MTIFIDMEFISTKKVKDLEGETSIFFILTQKDLWLNHTKLYDFL